MGAFSQGPMDPGFAATHVMPQAIQEFFADKQPQNHILSGITKDATGVVLAGCTVEVYETITPNNPNEPKGRFVGSYVSNADGSYAIPVYAGPGATFRIVSYKAGAPDVAGTTLNTLVGT